MPPENFSPFRSYADSGHLRGTLLTTSGGDNFPTPPPADSFPEGDRIPRGRGKNALHPGPSPAERSVPSRNNQQRREPSLGARGQPLQESEKDFMEKALWLGFVGADLKCRRLRCYIHQTYSKLITLLPKITTPPKKTQNTASPSRELNKRNP